MKINILDGNFVSDIESEINARIQRPAYQVYLP